MKLPPEIVDHPQWSEIAWAARTAAWVIATLVGAFLGALALLRWAPASRDVLIAMVVATAAAGAVGNVFVFRRKHH